MYNYNDRIQKVENKINKFSSIKLIKDSNVSVSELSSTDSAHLGWITKINIFASTSKIAKELKNYYQYFISLIQEEVTIAVKGSNLKYKIHYHNDGLLISILTNYTQDIKKSFDLSCYINTILKLISNNLKNIFEIEIKYGIGMAAEQGIYFKKPKIEGVENNYSFISTTDTSDIEKADYFSRISGKKITESTMFMTKLFYENISEDLIKENEKYAEWIKEEKDFSLKLKYYSCNVIITDFNNKIKTK